MNLSQWLLALASPLARKVLYALGIGVVTFVGVDAAVNALLAQAKSSWSGIAPGVMAYLALSGVNTGVSIVAGAVVARVALIPLKRFDFL